MKIRPIPSHSFATFRQLWYTHGMLAITARGTVYVSCQFFSRNMVTLELQLRGLRNRSSDRITTCLMGSQKLQVLPSVSQRVLAIGDTQHRVPILIQKVSVLPYGRCRLCVDSVYGIYSQVVDWLAMESHPQASVYFPDHRDRETGLLTAKPWYMGVEVRRTVLGSVRSQPNDQDTSPLRDHRYALPHSGRG